MTGPSHDDLDDEALIRAHLTDPSGNWAEALVERWQDRVYQWAYRVVRDHDTALDVSQDALIAMYRALPSYEPHGRFGAWLFTIVHNRARSSVRRRPLVRDSEVDLDDLVSHDPSPAERHESDERARRVDDAIRLHLEPVERAAIWLRAFEGLGVDDISSMLGFRNATGARGVLQTARRKLRRALGEDGGAEEGAS